MIAKLEDLDPVTKQYWTEEDFQELEVATTFSGLRQVAQRVILKMPRPIVQVCGPISTGGLGNVPDNLQIFQSYIERLQKRGIHVFNQMPFEGPMGRIKLAQTDRSGEKGILYDFYLPLFQSGLISKLYFMPNWYDSIGASWELAQAVRLQIPWEIIWEKLDC